MRVLVAGASGKIGREIVDDLLLQGHQVVALSRPSSTLALSAGSREGYAVKLGDAVKGELPDDLCTNVDAVISALGASVALKLKGRASYEKVDVPANLNLLKMAEAAGVKRFIYLGAHAGPSYEHTRYIQAHEHVASALEASSLLTTTIRPVAVFSALDDFVSMARNGVAQIIGDGSALTNPVSAKDVAKVVMAHLEAGPLNVSVGGKEVMSRRRIAEIAFEAVSGKPKIKGVPAQMPKVMAKLVRPFHPRLGDLMTFAAHVSVVDCIAPQLGNDTLRDYFDGLVQGG